MRKVNIFILLPLILCCLFSCNNLSDVLLESNALIEESADKQSAKLYINLHGIERTILPSEDDISMLTNFTLSGKIKGENEVVLGKWENIEMLQNKQIALKPGDWELNLTAYKYSLKYSGKNDVVLYKGDNQVSFDLMRIDSDGIDGSLDFTLDFSRAEKPENVALAIAHIEKIDGTILYENKELEIVDNSVNYTEFSIPAGTYRLCVTLYADLDGKIILANYKEILKIASSLVSQKTYKLNSFKNLYHINYHFNDTESYPATFVENVPEIFIASTGKIALECPERGGGWSFNGWYLDKSRTLPVTEIDSSCISDVDVYADWDFDIGLWIGDHEGGTIHRGNIFLYDSEKKTNYTKHDTFVRAKPNVYEYYVDYDNFDGQYKLDIDYEQYKLDPSIQVTVINETTSLKDSTEDDVIITAVAPDNRTKVYTIHATPVFNCKSKFQFKTDGIYYSSHTSANKIEFIGKKGDYGWFLFSCSNGNYKVYSDEVETIEESTFDGYSVLEEIDIPDSIKSIGKNAFSGCTNLKKINYLGTLRDWCNIEFESAAANPLGIGVNLYIDEALVKEIVIPEDIEKISNFAFCGYSVLESVIITNNVKEIGECAFKASGIKSIAISGSVREIGEQAFSNCKNLSQVVIADGVESIGRAAFHSTEIKSIEIPGSVKTISGAAFRNCNSLNQVILHEGIERIESQAFDIGSSLVTIEIPSSITYLASNAFRGIEKVVFSNGTTKICDNAFSGCIKLTHVEIPDSLTEIGDYAFSGCSKLSDLTFLNNISKIGEKAFSSCENLKAVIIPDSVQEIGTDAFYNCYNLENVTISGKVKKIDTDFKRCAKLQSVTYTGSLDDWLKIDLTDSFLFDNNDVIISSEINRNTKLYIDNCDVSTITKISIPDGVTTVRAFQKFTNLVEISMPDSVVEIRETSFAGCEKLKVINFSKKLRTIGDSAFRNCKSLKKITLPDETLEIIGYGTFSCCESLENFVVPGSVTDIGRLFDECSSLSEILIQDGVKTIKGNAFVGCKKLTNLTIPESCLSISNKAFDEEYMYYNFITYTGTIEQWKKAINNKPLNSVYKASLVIKCTDGNFTWER